MNKRLLLILALLLSSLQGWAALSDVSPEDISVGIWQQRRFSKLEKLVQSGAVTAPEDMVIYRYAEDTLQSWVNTFPVFNDDISAPGIAASPSQGGWAPSELYAVPDTATVMRLGGRRFLMKSQQSTGPDGTRLRVIYGLKLPAPEQVRREVMRYKSIFSPMLYSSEVFHSLGEVIIVNLLIFALCIALGVRSRRGKSPAKWLAVAISVAIFVYSFFACRSIIRNSDICLELYKLSELSGYTAILYASFISIFLCVPALLKNAGIKIFSGYGRVFYALVLGVLMVLETSAYGLLKEQNRLEVWACRLAIDRDLTLEMQLHSSENSIGTDGEIPQMIRQGIGPQYLTAYIADKYFPNLEQDYEVAAIGVKQEDKALEMFLKEYVGTGTLISRDSRFHYASAGAGRIRYTAIFDYAESGEKLLLGVEYKINNENRGYASILGITGPGKVEIPQIYTYAKYTESQLQFFKGGYPYPTTMNEFESGHSLLKRDGYLHFLTRVNEDETVIISRPVKNLFNHLHAASFLAVIVFILLTIIPTLRRHPRREERSYYRTRISVVLMAAMTSSLVLLTGVSIYFVYNSKENNVRTMMSDKINSIRSILETQFGMIPSGPEGIQAQDIMAVMKGVAEVTDTDLTLYDKSGALMLTTVPEPLSRIVLSGRMNSSAFNNIIHQNRRYFIGKEEIRRKTFYNMYAPLLNDMGECQAIICAPYTDNSFDFQQDAVMHAAAVITVFLILLILARIMSSTLLDRLFGPLNEMGRRMKETDLSNPEHIEYTNDDELTALVLSYNRMVDDIAESSRKLLLAERDKAWNGMARQVAHEIKNPLTPMKLQLQRLVRMKTNGDPKWVEKFDEVSSIVLEHIDILTDTANEFSELAKLPTERMTPIDLGALLQEEVSMFDNREGVNFEYIGLEKADITGPRPQLTRVFVNLLTNAVQAVDQREDGRIVVTLCKSSESGYYDITVEDNGPGVSEENLSKLFTPSFTTKSGGSGLGLAISRSILERCGATISYSRSFTLSGACFTVKYPINIQ